MSALTLPEMFTIDPNSQEAAERIDGMTSVDRAETAVVAAHLVYTVISEAPEGAYTPLELELAEQLNTIVGKNYDKAVRIQQLEEQLAAQFFDTDGKPLVEEAVTE